ncbi:FAD binding domain-containing protein [Candidatus Clostridium stratigraminis]|uniref:FAD binding domain-containing protein n=1 Tax=Candidatus Clostridium stratigraminis TaxID=3381661 RepID=A0ABW8T3G4_9CLOT
MQELQYFKPMCLNDALELLNKHGKDIRILAGGTDLIIALKDKLIVSPRILDIKAIDELKNISYSNEEGLTIGAAVSLNDIINSKEIIENYPILVEGAKNLANSLLRNRATLVGNLCNASPGGDMLSPSIVLEGVAEIASIDGIRKVPLKEFFIGVKRTILKENEIVTRVIFPFIKGKGKYLRKSRIKGHDLAQVAVAAFLKSDGVLNIAIGAAGPTPVIVEGLKNIDVIKQQDEIIAKVKSAIKPIKDQRASKEFRIAMAEYLTKQILYELGEAQ